MELKVLSDDADLLRLQVAGRIVQGEAIPEPDTLIEVLGNEGYSRNVLLSLADTQFVDSSGMSWLVVRHKRFCQAGGNLVLHSIPPSVMEILNVLRLELVLRVAESESAALEMIRGGSS
ncbi:MAG: STAS domain-containing protein [Planctomycetota bacterium]|jgi:stage II sporulation protein AA (anti-sigma F factor antagonist)